MKTIVVASICCLLAACQVELEKLPPCEGHIIKGCSETVYFKTDSAKISPKGIERLDWVKRRTEKFPDREVIITGYTDQRGTNQYNLNLSQRRAEAVQKELVKQGIDPHRMTVVYKGKSEAACDNLNCYITDRKVRVDVKSRHF